MTINEILDKQKSHLNKLTMWAETAQDQKVPIQIFPNDLLQYCKESVRQIIVLKSLLSMIKLSKETEKELEEILLGVTVEK